MKIRHYLVTVAVGSLFVAGCGASNSTTESSDTANAEGTGKYEEPVLSPVNDQLYMSVLHQMLYPPQAETDALRQVLKAGIARCMQKKGFTYVEAPGTNYVLTPQMDEADVNYVYEYLSPESAQKHGVSSAGFDISFLPLPPQYDDPAWEEALDGKKNDDSDDGCKGEAAKQLPALSKMRGLIGQVAKLNRESFASVDAARESVKAEFEPKWASCMKEKGFAQFRNFDSVSYRDGQEGVYWRTQGGPPSPAEVAVATASGECMLSTGYLKEVSYKSAVASNKAVAKKPGFITEYKKVHKELIDQVQKKLK